MHNLESQMPRLVVSVLGNPAVPARPRLTRQQLLITVFLACRSGPVRREALRHVVWDGDAVDLRTVWDATYRTRKALGRLDDGSLVLQPADLRRGTLCLADGVTTDVALLRQLRSAAATVSSETAIDLLTRGLALIGGAPFDGPGYDWAHHAEQLVTEATALIQTTIQDLTQLALLKGDLDLARQSLVTGLRSLPGDEVLCRLLMQVEHRFANVSGVHSAYASLVSFLDGIRLGGVPVGLQPDDETTGMYRRLAGAANRE